MFGAVIHWSSQRTTFAKLEKSIPNATKIRERRNGGPSRVAAWQTRDTNWKAEQKPP
jgi:hypothetical protein